MGLQELQEDGFDAKTNAPFGAFVWCCIKGVLERTRGRVVVVASVCIAGAGATATEPTRIAVAGNPEATVQQQIGVIDGAIAVDVSNSIAVLVVLDEDLEILDIDNAITVHIGWATRL